MAFIILMTGPAINGAIAASVEVVEKQINIIPDPKLTTNTNNIAGDNFSIESDYVLSDIERDGVYYGPYARASLFQMDHTGGNMVISSTFNFTYQEIMSGTSRFTVRIPAIWYNDVYNSISFTILNETGADIYYRSISGTSNLTTLGDNGIYIDCIVPLLPNKNYTFQADFSIIDEKKPNLLLSIEKLQLENNTDIRFYRLGAEYSSWGTIFQPYIYDFTETLDYIFPAWACVFHDGMGEKGLYGSNLDFGFGEELVIRDSFNINVMNGTNFSAYLPFRQRDANKVNWEITLELYSDYTDIWFIDPTNTSKELGTITLWVNDTEHYLLFSSSHWIELRPGFPPFISGGGVITVTLKPNRDITLINQYKSLDALLWSGYPQLEYHLTDSTEINMNYFISMSYTEGQWASVEPQRFYTSYDFGWGQGKVYPGTATMVFWLHNESGVYATGNLKNVRDNIHGDGPGDDDEEDILQKILSAVKDIPGTINGYIDFLWGKIEALGSFIWDTFIGFVDWLIDVFEHLKEYAVTLIYGLLLAIVPMLALLMTKMLVVSDKSKEDYEIEAQ